MSNMENIKKLLLELGAEETTSDGFTFIELDSRDMKKEQATSEQAAGTGNKQQA